MFCYHGVFIHVKVNRDAYNFNYLHKRNNNKQQQQQRQQKSIYLEIQNACNKV